MAFSILISKWEKQWSKEGTNFDGYICSQCTFTLVHSLYAKIPFNNKKVCLGIIGHITVWAFYFGLIHVLFNELHSNLILFIQINDRNGSCTHGLWFHLKFVKHFFKNDSKLWIIIHRKKWI